MNDKNNWVNLDNANEFYMSLRKSIMELSERKRTELYLCDRPVFSPAQGCSSSADYFRVVCPYFKATQEQAVVAHHIIQQFRLNHIPCNPFFLKEIVPNLRLFHKAYMERNPYFQAVKSKRGAKYDCRFGHRNYEKFRLFTYSAKMKDRFDCMDNVYIGCFDEDVDLPCIQYEGYKQMCLTPFEMETMQKDIEKASGKVLALGLGMGYYPFMVARKSNVKSVTVIEKNGHLIELFYEYILPHFPLEVRNKIQVIQGDALDYMSRLQNSGNKYDYCFVKIFSSAYDTLYSFYYIALSKLAKTAVTKMSFWLEKEFVGRYYLMLAQMILFLQERNGVMFNYEELTEYLLSKTSDSFLYEQDLLRCYVNFKEWYGNRHGLTVAECKGILTNKFVLSNIIK